MRRKLYICGILAAVLLPSAFAGTLRLGTPEVNGGTVVLPVVLEGGTGGVAALDFTLQYDPAVFQPAGATAGAAAQSAHKQIQSNEVSPGNYVVMMFGMNQSTLESGQVASITLNTKSQPTSNQSDVAIKKTAFASADGVEIESQGSDQTVTFAVPPTDGNNGGETPPTDGGNTPPPVTQPETPPAPSPDPQTPSPPTPPPGGGAGAPVPSPGGKPGTDNDGDTDSGGKPGPMVINAPAQAAAPLADTANRLARLNAATQQLERSRAEISGAEASPDGHDNGAESESTDTGDTRVVAPGAPTVSSSPGQATQIALISNPVALDSALAKADAGAIPARTERGQVIPDSSRHLLIIVGAVVAVALTLLRFAGRLRRRRRAD